MRSGDETTLRPSPPRVRELDRYSLEDKWLPPKENFVHELAACLCIEDSIEVDLTVIVFLGLQVASLHDPDRELCIKTSEMVSIGTLTFKQAGRGEELERRVGEEEREEEEERGTRGGGGGEMGREGKKMMHIDVFP